MIWRFARKPLKTLTSRRTLPSPAPCGSVPDTWVAVYSGDIGNTFGPKGFRDGLQPAGLVVEVPQVMIHESDEPNVVAHLFDADVLTGEDGTEIDLLAVEADTKPVSRLSR